MPLISVVVPTYNAEKTIQLTLQSVLEQTFTDFELLIINDGSTDATLEVIAQINDPRIKVFSYPNAGPNPSRNRGIAQATGEYVAFLDADDCWRPRKLEAQYNALKANSQAAVAYSWTDWVDAAGNFLRRGSHLSASGDVYAQLLLVDFIESGSNPLIRADAIATTGGFDESMPAAQDWDMWLRLAARYPFVAVPEVQILYRVSPGSWSANVQRMETASLRVIERAFLDPPASIQSLKHDILANRYKGLTFKVLDGVPQRQQGLLALRFLWNALRYDPTLLRARVLAKILLKIIAMSLLPSSQAQALFKRNKALFNVNALLGYLRLDPS